MLLCNSWNHWHDSLVLVKILSRSDFPATRQIFVKDLISGVTVAIVALPLAIGFGITAGMSAAAGISTAIIAGFIAGLFGGSRFQVSGPTGAMTVVLIPVINKFGIAAIPTLGLMAGLIVIAMSLIRLGSLINKVPNCVVEGFTVGIAIVISLQQLPFAFGVIKGEGDRTLVVAIHTVQKAVAIGVHWQTLLVVFITLAIKFNIVKIVESFKIRMYFPASFSALLLTTLIVKAFDFNVATIGNIPRNVSTYTSPILSSGEYLSLITPALSIAVLVAIESLLSARVADDISNVPSDKKFQPNQELFGQGLATTLASVFGGMPATGAIARTNVNVRSGASTRLASMIHSVVLLVIVIFLAPIFSQIPSAAIAGVLIGTSFRIFNKASMLEIFKSSKSNIFIYIATAVVTVSVDLIWGIGFGIALYLLINLVKKSNS
ncbi:MAG: sodium-independent anion transporter [Actinobacteria bacterium]|nr:sodium-independent anion transporter [Actinomycetota bacterium]